MRRAISAPGCQVLPNKLEEKGSTLPPLSLPVQLKNIRSPGNTRAEEEDNPDNTVKLNLSGVGVSGHEGPDAYNQRFLTELGKLGRDGGRTSL